MKLSSLFNQLIIKFSYLYISKRQMVHPRIFHHSRVLVIIEEQPQKVDQSSHVVAIIN